jgi:hypothetical protein
MPHIVQIRSSPRRTAQLFIKGFIPLDDRPDAVTRTDSLTSDFAQLRAITGGKGEEAVPRPHQSYRITWRDHYARVADDLRRIPDIRDDARDGARHCFSDAVGKALSQ